MRYIIAGLLMAGLIIAVLAGTNGGLPAGSAQNAVPEQSGPGLNLTPTAEATRRVEATQTVEPCLFPASPTPGVTATSPVIPSATSIATATLSPTIERVPSPAPTDAAAWKEWPVIPAIPQEMRLLYQRGLDQDTIDPHAFTVLGDCQSEARDFLGLFEDNLALVSTLPEGLQETVANFDGSFDRYNPAAKSGSSAGSLLFAAWNDNEEGECLYGETPVECELRVHRPGIVFIHTGTHYETQERNWYYLTIIIEKILARGAVPVLVTKADNLELDEHINQNMAKLAEKYGLPLWNFWSSVQDLPEQGLMPNGMHLTAAGHKVHRLGALEMLDAVWLAVR